MRRKFGIGFVILGVLLVAFAPVARWAIAPRLTVLPGDLNTTRVYTGTAAVLANPTTLSGTTVGPAVLRNVPITVTHSDQAVATTSKNALIADKRVITVPGFTVASLTYNLSVDRKTFQSNQAIAGVNDARGLVFNWPIGTKPHNYTGWVSDSGTTTVMKYAGTATRGGVSTYVFTTTVPAARITDPQLLRLLPASATKAELMRQVPAFGFSTAKLTQLNTLMAKLADPVPLAYTYAMTGTFYIHPKTGVVVDLKWHETRAVNFVTAAGLVPLATVMDMSWTSTPATLTAAANDARDNASKMSLITDTLPLVSLIAGVGFVVVGVALIAVRRRRIEPPVDTPLRELLTTS